MPRAPRFFPRLLFPLACLAATVVFAAAFVNADEAGPRLTVEADVTVREMDRHRLLGTNVALWHGEATLNAPRLQPLLDLWRPAQIRLPGGSYSNEYYWNGHGVRRADGSLDLSKRAPDGRWAVDYSAYQPGFRVAGQERLPAKYQGEIDVRTQHEFVKRVGAEPFVTVNYGSGDPRMAAEWVRFAKKHAYGVGYWEVGNELNGEWEMGHRLPDGSAITGELYAIRYKDYAAAIKAVDPDARVGGPASSDLSADFAEELLMLAGDQVDFISVHAYPVGVQLTDPAAKFRCLDDLRPSLDRIRGWINQHQPARAEAIELGVTEWNIKVNEDRDTGDMLGGLWSAAWIGEMFREGVSFAHQWDLFTNKEKGGHSTFLSKGSVFEPKATYWANYLWSQLMADRLVASRLDGAPSAAIRAYATSSERGVQILLVNGGDTAVHELAIVLRSERPFAPSGRLNTFSRRTYFWDPHASAPVWSLPPEATDFPISENLKVSLPASSARVLELPWQGVAPSAARPLPPESSPTLRLVLPDTAPADLPVEGWVLAMDSASGRPWRGPLPPAELELSGPASADLRLLPLENAAARFILTPHEAGTLHVRATAGAARAGHTLELKRISQRDLVLFTFDNPLPDWNARSHFTLRAQSTVKPNEAVAEVSLLDALPAKDADNLFHFEPLPSTLVRRSVSGVFAQLRADPDLRCADPKARVNVILQSTANHWIPLGSVALSDLVGKWHALRLPVSDPALLEAMSGLYALRIQLQSTSPVTGSIQLDDLGFTQRAAEPAQ